MPQKWKDALKAAEGAGKIPSIPVSRQTSNGATPTYDGHDPGAQPVCSASYQCRLPGQLWDAPDGVIGISFDDGPLSPSANLNAFLHDNGIPSTHFYIGTSILQDSGNFKYAFETLKADIAVHTWTHPYMTTLSNEQVVAELGWTMQLIYDSTGGKVAKYWRPPYGDTDARVDAIAHEVFGLTAVIWNHDTDDWQLTTGGTTQEQINSHFDEWLSGSKSPGLICLEHELSDQSVQAFKNNYHKFAEKGWTVQSVARLSGGQPYQSHHADLFQK
ncbi:hypothetical protein K488DRAFT_71449 [Vararia minispora EC-137]|uniref:Uncharacterized protein n=1 Tax=Vararia minispora EC-137 TaxID=1314806 RepID=A0ACB8QIH3_9AGAM|nr:hypothetical protein K488DRAFT_71449 [Vararia minispora EC-137]